MYENRAISVEVEEEIGQVDSADSYVLYSEGRAGVCVYGMG